MLKCDQPTNLPTQRTSNTIDTRGGKKSYGNDEYDKDDDNEYNDDDYNDDDYDCNFLIFDDDD